MHRQVIRRRKLHEEVAAHLEAQINAKRYAVGDPLPSERELMDQYGVGRPAVREALLSLEKMGLVALASGARARVVAPSAEALVGQLAGSARRLLAQPNGVRAFQQARLFFEVGLAREAAQAAEAEDLERLSAALEANRQAIGDPEAFNRTDVAFHYVLATIPRNVIFTALHEAIEAWLREQRTISLRNPGADESAYAAHERIHDAIAARDPDAAETAMRAHLHAIAELYWKQRGADQE